MIGHGIQMFSGKRVLLLQGPVGPFFSRLARDLRNEGAQVYKVNFNAGDWFFYSRGALNYRGTMEGWPAWLTILVRQLEIEVILMFGDCRPVHQAARAIALQQGLEIGVFEEGYIRPDYITLERFGVNAYSRLSRDPEYYRGKPLPVSEKIAVGNTYWAMVWCGFWYFFSGALGKPWFRHYQHHRPLTLLEALPWARAIWRKYWYRWVERGAQQQLTIQWKNRYFLVPLQVFNDGQIIRHSGFAGIESFIVATLHSFARHGPAETLLVFKHHPMDRGYRDYTKLIRYWAEQAGIGQRVRYLHDQHLPSLLSHARGVVVINSSVGLSALYHGKPTVVCGAALYDMPGLTYQQGLDRFWTMVDQAAPDPALYQYFRDYLIATTQLNGSFYKPLRLPGSFSGLVWNNPENEIPGQPGTASTAAFPVA